MCHETGKDKLWISHEPVVGSPWVGEAVLFNQMKMG